MVSDNIFYSQGVISYNDRCKALNQKGRVLWFTGLSGSGKSTIAIEVERKLFERQNIAFRLDGDNIRHGLNSDLGFSDADRNENIRRIAETAKLFKEAGLITLVSFISPFKKMRDYAKEIIGKDDFTLIYIKADVETCSKRDPKGLYEKVKNGEIKEFTGVSSPYEEPENPDILIDTRVMSVDDAVNTILEHI